jgi:hypothetical protein
MHQPGSLGCTPQKISMRLIIGFFAFALLPVLLPGQAPVTDLYEGMSIQETAPEPSAKNAEVQPKPKSTEAEPKSEIAETRPKSENAEVEPKSNNAEAQAKSENAEAQPKPAHAEVQPQSERTEPQPDSENAEFQPKAAPACHLDKIIPRTNKRLQEFVQNVNRITATESLLHERLDKDGKAKEHERRKFEYVVVIEELKPGHLVLDEFRNGQAGNFGFPGDIATMGMPTLALIFHPYHRDEFDMTCQGLSAWHDRQAWQVHFSQRKDKPARMSVLRAGGRTYPVLLMGTAWIDSETFQIIHLETDLLQPIPEVRLVKEHQELDYGPVRFEARNVSLWLPKEADIFLDSGGKRFHHEHTFTNYQIFSVEYGEKIGDPKPDPVPNESIKLPM